MPRIPLDDWLTAVQPEPDWLVPGILPRGAIFILAGDSGVGKSLLCYSLAIALASGRVFLGRSVPLGRVLYFDEENSEQDLRAYLHALWCGHGSPDRALLSTQFRLEHFSLASLTTHPYDYIRMAVDEHRPDLVVMDTATPIFRIQDENDNAEASRAIRALRVIKSISPQTAFLVLKHTRIDGKTGKRDIRGAKTWRGELDGVIYHTNAPGRPRNDGLRSTLLEPGKVRAWGLQARLTVTPETPKPGCLILHAKPLHDGPDNYFWRSGQNNFRAANVVTLK